MTTNDSTDGFKELQRIFGEENVLAEPLNYVITLNCNTSYDSAGIIDIDALNANLIADSKFSMFRRRLAELGHLLTHSTKIAEEKDGNVTHYKAKVAISEIENPALVAALKQVGQGEHDHLISDVLKVGEDAVNPDRKRKDLENAVLLYFNSASGVAGVKWKIVDGEGGKRILMTQMPAKSPGNFLLGLGLLLDTSFPPAPKGSGNISIPLDQLAKLRIEKLRDPGKLQDCLMPASSEIIK